jgi:hypothetical protein
MDPVEIPTPPGTFARVIKDWVPEGNENRLGNCMSLRVGEIILVRSRLEHGWWLGRQEGGEGKGGWFPGYCCVFSAAAGEGEVRL